MNTTLIILLIIALIIIAYKERKIRQFQKERDYYIEIDEENERLKRKLIEK